MMIVKTNNGNEIKITEPNIVVKDVPYHEVKTDEEIARRKFLEEQKKMKCLSPFKELHFGDKSIYRSERFMASHLYYCINPLS